MTTEPVRYEPWPTWAKATLIALLVLAILVVLPWIFMWTTMAASCVPMMNGMPGMMGPEMMR
jgi:hypothetical protein